MKRLKIFSRDCFFILWLRLNFGRDRVAETMATKILIENEKELNSKSLRELISEMKE